MIPLATLGTKFAADVRHWIIAGLALAVIVLGVWLQISRARLDAAQARNEASAAKITAQNQAIQQWQAAGEQVRKQVEQAQQAAAMARTESTRKVVRLQTEPVPAECDQAVQWAAGKANELAEGWR